MKSSKKIFRLFLIKKFIQVETFCRTYNVQIVFIALVVFHIFLRFYLLFQRANLGWDQIDSAWAAKSILVDHNFLLHGPVAKGDSGIYMGPLYYYLIAPFYLLTNLDPIASPIFQAVASIGNLVVLLYVTKKLFGTNVSLVAGFINVFSATVIYADRIQSAYYLIVPISYLIFYALYKVIQGESKYILLLALSTGISLHVDFTSVFYPMFIFLALPFFPRNKNTLKYIAVSIPLFLLFLLPSVLSDLSTKHVSSNSLIHLFHTSYHGLHAKRVFQIIHDAFISFEQILQFKLLRPFVFMVFPIFMLIYYLHHGKRNSLLLFYLISLWILIPWLVLATYSGELTDYYFSLPRDIVIALLAYLTVYIYSQKSIIGKAVPVLFWSLYVINSVQVFLKASNGDLLKVEQRVRATVHNKGSIPFMDHHSDSYVYYVYTTRK